MGTEKVIETEQVFRAVEVDPGVVEVEEFWIAYPASVGTCVAMDARISRAWGRGRTRREALDAATR